MRVGAGAHDDAEKVGVDGAVDPGEYGVVVTALVRGGGRVVMIVAETCCLRSLLQELRRPIGSATTDNVRVFFTSLPIPMQHCRTKHIELDINFVREKVALGALRVLHVPSSS
jgi:hypothetical protein